MKQKKVSVSRVIARLYCVKTRVIARVYCVKMRALAHISCVKTHVYMPLPTNRRAFTRASTRFLLCIPTLQVSLFVSKSISSNSTLFLHRRPLLLAPPNLPLLTSFLPPCLPKGSARRVQGAKSIKRGKESRTEKLTFQRGKWSFVYANVLPAFFVLVLFVVDSDVGSSLKAHLSVVGPLKKFFWQNRV